MNSNEQIVNQALSGIAFYHRDIDLSNTLKQLYQINHIIQHPAILQISGQFGGLKTNTRFVIASAHVNSDDADTAWLEKGAFFKVLDILFINQRTQILLLHLPAEAIEIFTTQRIPFEDKLLETHRQIFIEHTYQPPIAALQTAEWRAKTSAPIGIDEKDELYYHYEPPQKEKVEAKKVNQFKAGANRQKSEKKSFWQRLFGN